MRRVTVFHVLLKKLRSRCRREGVDLCAAQVAFKLIHKLGGPAGRIIPAKENLMATHPTEVHHQKIQHAKSQFEENQGKTIRADKITEWALLDITDRLLGIESHLSDIQVAVGLWRKQSPPPR
jgi:hypothetical protein